jgi:uncharacterized protein (TIGR02266 family)
MFPVPSGGTSVIRVVFPTFEDLASWYAAYIAAGWAEVDVAQDFAQGSGVRLSLSAPDVEPFEVEARVLEARASEGRRMLRLGLASSARLAELIASRTGPAREPRLRSPATGGRQAPRFDTFLAARFRNYQQLVNEYVTDISRGGLFIRTPRPPAPGSLVTVILKFPNEETLEVTAEVLRTVSPEAAAAEGTTAGAAVRFLEGQPQVVDTIDRLIAEHLARRPRVLVVDDNPFFLRVLQDGLEEVGFEVVPATGGTHAVRLLSKLLYELDAVVLDIHMPNLDGVGLLKRIRRLKNEVRLRVVMVTGANVTDRPDLYGPDGPDALLSKGMALPELVEAIEVAILGH